MFRGKSRIFIHAHLLCSAVHIHFCWIKQHHAFFHLFLMQMLTFLWRSSLTGCFWTFISTCRPNINACTADLNAPKCLATISCQSQLVVDCDLQTGCAREWVTASPPKDVYWFHFIAKASFQLLECTLIILRPVDCPLRCLECLCGHLPFNLQACNYA